MIQIRVVSVDYGVYLKIENVSVMDANSHYFLAQPPGEGGCAIAGACIKIATLGDEG